MFEHLTLDYEFPELICETKETGRTYQTPEGNVYPSITTILGSVPSPELDAWKLRVGEREAERIKRQAGLRGDKVHNMAEKYLSNDSTWSKGLMPIDVFLFNQIKSEIDRRLSAVLIQEKSLYSKVLKIAGRVDCIGIWDGELSVIDFKTSLRLKTRDEMKSYFMQTAFYAAAFYEMTDIPIKKLVLLVMSDKGDGMIEISTPMEWLKPLVKIRKNYGENS